MLPNIVKFKGFIAIVFLFLQSSFLIAQSTEDDDILYLLPAILAAVTHEKEPPFVCTSYVDLQLESTTINTNTRIPSGCYNVNDSIWVYGGRLTIDPGVELRFAADKYFYVSSGGSVKAEGTKVRPITFSGRLNSKGYWQGLEFSSSVNNSLKNVRVINGGNSITDSGIEIDSSSSSPTRISLENVSVRGSQGYGIGVDEYTILNRFSKVTMTGNRRPIYIHGNTVYKLGSDSKFNGNDEDNVYVISDTLTTNQTWKKLNVPYQLGSIWVNSSLTINSGVQLKFSSDAYFYVSSSGVLNAIGGEIAPINFEGVLDEAGYWKGIEFAYSGALSTLSYVNVINGGNSTTDAGIEFETTSLSPSHIKMTNVSVSGSLGYGIWFDADVIIDEFSNVTLTGNRRPILASANSVYKLGSDSTYTGNEEDFIYVVSDYVTTSQTWQKLDVPYHSNSITVSANLSFEQGVNVKFFSSDYLDISSSGVLSAVGTAEEPIIFEGVQDEAGYWEGVEFSYSSSLSTLSYVNIINAGESVSDSAIKVDSSISNPSRISFDNVLVSGSLGYGIGFDDGVIIDEFSGVTLTDNRRPIYIHANYVSKLSADNTYTGNQEDFVYIESDYVSTSQAWQKLDVPYHSESITVSGILTLEQGINLKFFSSDYLDVSGSGVLNAIGTAAEPIIIQGVIDETGYWEGVEFSYTSSLNTLSYVNIINAGESISASAIKVQSSTSNPSRVNFDNVSVSGSLGYGVGFGDAAIIDGFTSVTLTNNRRPLYIHANYVSKLGSDSTYKGNQEDFVYIESDYVSTSQTWQKLDVPYYSESLTVSGNLTLDPGVNLKFFSGDYLDVSSSGSLKAVGNALNRISIGGVFSQQGYWDGIEFSNTTSINNQLDYVDVTDGATNPSDANIYIQCYSSSPSRVSISNSNISNSFGWGIITNEDCILTLSNNAFANNFSGDISGLPL